ncbi:hypothetical protein [Bacillus cereus]|uniref:hypothetical protein n=1 Tax=Bacillus cereus TaxID=1396 RepID=UPI000BF67E89|nr:hypothetical protein [Bacillus cereus]PEX84896.1 hypothetical protein CN450_18185 [Bacillus cereus]
MKKAVWIPLVVILVIALGFTAKYFMENGKVDRLIEKANASMDKESYKEAAKLYAEANELKDDKKMKELGTLANEMNRLIELKKTESPSVILEQVHKIEKMPKHQFDKRIVASISNIEKEVKEVEVQLEANEVALKKVEELIQNKEWNKIKEATKDEAVKFTLNHSSIKEQEKKWSELVMKAESGLDSWTKAEEEKKQVAEQKEQEGKEKQVVEQKKQEEKQKQVVEQTKQEEPNHNDQQNQTEEPKKQEQQKELTGTEAYAIAKEYAANHNSTDADKLRYYKGVYDNDDGYGFEAVNGSGVAIYFVNKRTGAVSVDKSS